MFGIEKRLKIDFTWVLVGNLFYSACQWMIVVVLAKLGSPEHVGQYALGLAVSGPIILFANLQLRSLMTSDVSGRFRFEQYMTFRLASIGAALVLVAALAAASSGIGIQTAIIVLVGFAQALELVSDAYFGRMQKQGRMDWISWSLMLRGPLSLGGVCLAMYFTRSLVWALVALAMGRLFVLFIWDARLGKSVDDAPAGSQSTATDMLALLRTALPLGVISMLAAVNLNIPRYFVQGTLGTAELGMFAAVASLLNAGNLVVSASGQAMFLHVAQAVAASNRARFRNFVSLAIGLGALLGGAGVLISTFFGTFILTHLFRPEYARYSDVLVRLMIAATLSFIASGLGFVMTAARSIRVQIPLLLVTGAAGVVAGFILIPRYGLIGAADTALVGWTVQVAGSVFILLRVDRRLKSDCDPPDVLSNTSRSIVEGELA